ncbi:hypothetical protein PHET_07524 [Paragonimus heterotremus]|uniref:HMG box domain-containing protein n=1 Tax=Paragonimus heterotremus TaxID=100268 RepID=A0A8J4SIL4_9TREM|nr:hypothetical protein PHET_07524 [Paragonimus heterotremus]
MFTTILAHAESFPSVESIVAPENSYPASYSTRSTTFSLVANNTPNIDLTDYRRSPGYEESPPCFGSHPSNSVTPNDFTESHTDPSSFTFNSDNLWLPKLSYSHQAVQNSVNRSAAINLQQLFMKNSGETYTCSAVNCGNIGSTCETKPRSALDCLQTWLQQPFACCYNSFDDSTTTDRKQMAKNYSHEDYTNETVTSGFRTKGTLMQPHDKLITSTTDSDTTGGNLQGSINRWDYGRFPNTYGKIESDSYSNASVNSDMNNTTKSEINAPCRLSTKSNEPRWRSKNNGHIKKPLNAFMLFMKEMRAQVIAECTLKESAAINQILGRKWHALSREAQAKYYELAKKEKELHQRLYPGWSARDNYATQIRRRNRHVNNVSSTGVPNMLIKPSETQNREYSTRKHNMEHLRTISASDLFQYNSSPNATNPLPYSDHNINLPPTWKSKWDSAQGLHLELMKNCSNFVSNDPGWRGSVQPMNSDGQHANSWSDYPSVALTQSDRELVKKTVSTTVHTPLETVLPSGLCKAYESTPFLETGFDAAAIQRCLCFEASKYHSTPSVHQMPTSTYEQIGDTLDHSQTAGHSSTPNYNTTAHRQTTTHPYSTNIYPISYLSDLAVSQFTGATSQRESYWDRNTDSVANQRTSGQQLNFVESSNIQHASVFSSLINSLAST